MAAKIHQHKQIFRLGSFPEVGQKQKTEKKRKRRLNDGNNNGWDWDWGNAQQASKMAILLDFLELLH